MSTTTSTKDSLLREALAEWAEARARGDEEDVALAEAEVMAAEEALGIEVGGPESAVTLIAPKLTWKPSPELLAVAKESMTVTADKWETVPGEAG